MFFYLDDSAVCSPKRCHCVFLDRNHSNGGEENVPEAAIKPVFSWIGSFHFQPVSFVMIPTEITKRITKQTLQKRKDPKSLNTKNSTYITYMI